MRIFFTLDDKHPHLRFKSKTSTDVKQACKLNNTLSSPCVGFDLETPPRWEPYAMDVVINEKLDFKKK